MVKLHQPSKSGESLYNKLKKKMLSSLTGKRIPMRAVVKRQETKTSRSTLADTKPRMVGSEERSPSLSTMTKMRMII